MLHLFARTALKTIQATTLGILAITATGALAHADVITLWATNVPETSVTASTTPWANESYAALAPTCNNCNTTTSCQYATNSANSNTTPLQAVDFSNFTLPSNHRIVRVQAEVACRYNEGTTANVGFRAVAPGYGLDSGWRNSASFNSLAVGGVYVCSERLGSPGDITSLDTAWTAEKINNLQLQVRRQTGLTNNTLRVLSMKVVVTTELNASAPYAPTNLRATNTTSNSIALAWNDNSSNETGFVLYQLNPGLDPNVPTNWTMTNLPVNTSSTVRTSLASNSNYRFYVRAINSTGLSASSNMLLTSTATPPTGNQFFINEFRMTGGALSYVEVVAPAGTMLDSSYRLLVISGSTGTNGGALLSTKYFDVAGIYPTVTNMGAGMGTAKISFGLAGGTRAGYAFVRVVGAQMQVLDFVTYRGGSNVMSPITSNVPGMIGSVGALLPHTLGAGSNTLKLVGSGCHRGYFSWALPGTDGTPNAVNLGQAFSPCP